MRVLWVSCLLGLIVVSGLFSVPVPVQAQVGQPEVNVQWELHNSTSSDSASGTRQRLIFGNKPQLVITYDNGTKIWRNNYRVNFGDVLHYTLATPKALLEDAGSEFEKCRLSGLFDNTSVVSYFDLGYDASDESWEVRSEYNGRSFFEFDQVSSQVAENAVFFNVTFVGVINSSSPVLLYGIVSGVDDSLGNHYDGVSDFGHYVIDLGTNEGWHYRPAPTFNIRVLNETLQPIRYSEAGDTLIFEMSMEEDIGYAFFEIGPMASFDQQEYWKNITWWAPSNWSDPDTDWYIYRQDIHPPHLGFSYNSTLDETTVFLFYINRTARWEEDEDGWIGWRGWMWDTELLIDNTNLSHFINYNSVASGPIESRTIRWQCSLTEEVLKRETIHVEGTRPPPTYGGVIEIYPHGHWGAVGVKCYSPRLDRYAEPGQAWLQWNYDIGNPLKLSYHDLLNVFSIYDEFNLLAYNIGYEESFEIIGTIYGREDFLNGTGEPYWLDSSWRRRDITLEQLKVELYSRYRTENATHYIYHYSPSYLIIDIETSVIVDKFFSLVNETIEKENPDESFWTEINSSTGLLDLLSVDNVSVLFYPNQINLTFQALFLETAPETAYSFSLELIQNHSLYHSTGDETGPWVLDGHVTEDLRLWENALWRNPEIGLGDVWTCHWRITDEDFLDLDGNEETEYDQYIVRSQDYWSQEGSWQSEWLDVDLLFDPTPGLTTEGDEFLSHNWMGKNTVRLTSRWNSTYFWYHASDGSFITKEELEQLNGIFWEDKENWIPESWIAFCLVNSSSEDFTDLWWLQDYTWETSWFGFGMEESFQLAMNANTSLWGKWRSEFAGYLLFRENATLGANGVPDFYVSGGTAESNETTHLFLIEDAESIEFQFPLDSEDTFGNITVGVNEEVDFGVRILNVNGSCYPTKSLHVEGMRGYWDYIYSAEVLSGLDPSDFEYMVSSASINEISFHIHYTVALAGSPENPDLYNHRIDIKVDQYVGNWLLHQFDNSVLQDRGFAIAYFTDLTAETETQFLVNESIPVNNDAASLIGDIYQFGAENHTYAYIQMGGQSYIWGKDGESYNCSAATIPLSAISDIYETETGTTITRWTLNSTYYFLLSGFSQWEGYSIDNDPIFSTLTTAILSTTPYPLDFGFLLLVIGIISTGVIVSVIVIIFIRKRNKPA